MPKLTKKVVDSLKPDRDGRRDVFAMCSELRGFGARMKPSGRASYFVRYKTEQGATRRLVIGQVGALTPDEARTLAQEKLGLVKKGRDPSKERHETRKALTIGELCECYLEAADAGLVLTQFGRPKRETTLAIDRGRVERHIKPLIGSRIADHIDRADVRLMADAITTGKTAGIIKTTTRGKAVVTGGAGTAARVVQLLGGMWSWASERNLVTTPNPVRGVKMQRGETKDRVLSVDELRRLGVVLRECDERTPMACAALRLIALTGMRRSEAFSLRWDALDDTKTSMRLEKTKTGRSMRPLGQRAANILRSVPMISETWVFPGRNGGGSADLKKSVAAIFDAAGLSDARSQEMRRTFASFAGEFGYADATIREMLGHKRRGVTEKHYVRRSDTALVAAATIVSEAIGKALDCAAAEVIVLRSAGE